MKKVLLSVNSFPPDFGGSGLRAKNFSDRMKGKYGYEYLVLCIRGKKKDYIDSDNITRINIIGEEGLTFPLHALSLLFRMGSYLHKRSKDIDLLHFFSFSWMNRVLMLYNLMFLRKKAILEVTLDNSDDPMTLLNVGIRNRIFRHFTWPLLRRIDIIIVGSEYSVDSSIRAGIDKERIMKLPHPCDKEIFGKISFSEKKRLRKKLGLPDKFILFNVGRVQHRKNQEFLVECLKILDSRDIVLVLVGPYDEKDSYIIDLKGKIRESGLEKQVYLKGEQDNVNEFMIASDLFVFSSRSEGFPNVIPESIISGLPVLTTYFECLSDYVVPTTGIMIDNKGEFDDEIKNIFSAEITKVFNKTVEFDRESIRKFGEENLSTEYIDRKYDKLYKKLTIKPRKKD